MNVWIVTAQDVTYYDDETTTRIYVDSIWLDESQAKDRGVELGDLLDDVELRTVLGSTEARFPPVTGHSICPTEKPRHSLT